MGGTLCFDGRTLSVTSYYKVSDGLDKKNILYNYDNLIDEIWTDRPALPDEPAFEHEPRFAGLSAAEKLALVREKMSKYNIERYLVTALDEVAWLLNIRGNDIPNNPFVYSYAFITSDLAHIFIPQKKLKSISTKLMSQGFTLHEYNELPDFLRKVNGPALYNRDKMSMDLYTSLPEEFLQPVDGPGITPEIKSVKTETELANIRNAYIKDGVVLVRLLKWLDETDVSTLTEGDVARQLIKFRNEQSDYLYDSFPTVAAYGENAAQAHYNPGEKGVSLAPEGFLLVDTGAQYLDGTTDTTRNIVLGPLSEEMKWRYTLVLKGHIALARQIFPAGTESGKLDILARQYLWDAGLDYGHGTGHGIGYCLSVHEGPFGIPRTGAGKALVPGVILSNEPAFYREGHYGIRLENVLCVKEMFVGDNGKFLGFEPLMYCPFDLRAVKPEMLTPVEQKYLDEYHKMTYEVISPFLEKEEQEWLKKATAAVGGTR